MAEACQPDQALARLSDERGSRKIVQNDLVFCQHGLMTRRPITRFAPSPTGHLHLGHALAAWAVEAMAQAVGAQMLLRIEDIDPTRCRPEFEAAIVEDLAWLGLNYAGPVVRQSERMPLYARVIGHLKAAGLVYPCSCTRKQVRAASPGYGPDGPLYGGTCKTKGPTPGKPVAWRLDLAKALQRTGPWTLIQDPGVI